jgi:hypothetical protein
MAISPHDEVYVCDGRKYSVQVFTVDGARLLRAWDVPMVALSRDSHYPVSIAVASWNEVYVIKQQPTHVYVFRTDGSFVRTWNYISALESVDCAKPVGISTASNGEVFVLHKRVRVFKPDGTFVRAWEIDGDEPQALCVAFGEVYVVSKTACYVYDVNGNHVARWVGLSGARHVSVSPQGRVYVAEENGVRMFEHGRAVRTYSDAKNPLAVAVGPDNLFVCRSDTHTVETITLN